VITRKGIIIFLFVISLTWLHGAENASMQPTFSSRPRPKEIPGYSGDRQHGQAGDIKPLRVKVVNVLSEPVAGIPVIFEVVAYPAGGSDYKLDRRLVPTDSSGMAVVNFQPGTAGGEYQLIARIRSDEEENIQLFTTLRKRFRVAALYDGRSCRGTCPVSHGNGHHEPRIAEICR
jgi:hypothetical protein